MNIGANTSDALLAELDGFYDAYVQLINETSLDDLNFVHNGKWSICQNILHVNRSNQLTNVGYASPKWFLKLIFGSPSKSSRTTEEVIQAYKSKLSQGAKSHPILEANHAVCREKGKLLTEYHSVFTSLRKNLTKWSDEDLHHYNIYHPILGKITALEMLSFTVYHQYHHLNTMCNLLKLIKEKGL